MLVVETVGRIRREHFVQGKSIKEIARGLRMSRNTVRKILRSGETSFAYERDVQPQPKLGHWKSDLDRMLAGNAGKSARERLTLIRLFEDLHGLGYAGGYDAVRRYARSWQREHASQTAPAFVPLSFAPGEAYQFDWSHEIVLLNGVTVTVKVAHMRLAGGRGRLRAGDGGRRPFGRRDPQHPRPPPRSRTGRDRAHAGGTGAAAGADRRLRQIRSTQEHITMERTDLLDM